MTSNMAASSAVKRAPLIELTGRGLYCRAGDFFIDPVGETPRAVITHGHSDHARAGAGQYFCSPNTLPILQQRLGDRINISPKLYEESFAINDVEVSLHPAGHIRGSAQVRISDGHEVWVVTGDYKRCADPTAETFSVVPCDVLLTETTFASPVYQWQSGAATAQEIYAWWQQNASEGLTSLLFCYALGKAQRILAELTAYTEQTVCAHGAIMPLYQIYHQQGVRMLPIICTSSLGKDFDYSGQLIIAPPAAHRSAWMKRFKAVSTGFASGWMQVRGHRRRRGYHRGFVLSDHADWPGLVNTVKQCGARRVYTMHGNTELFARYLREQGLQADTIEALRLEQSESP